MKHTQIHIGFLIIFMIGSMAAKAQEITQQSQLLFAKNIVNPAAYDNTNFNQVWIKHRAQWVGFGNGSSKPKSTVIGYQQSDDDEINTVGGMAYRYKEGLISNVGLSANFAHGIELSDDVTLRFGLSATGYQYRFAFEEVRINSAFEPLLDGQQKNSLGFDFGFGTYLSGKRFYTGISVVNLFKRISLQKNLAAGSISTGRKYYLMGGYSIEIKEGVSLDPNIIINHSDGDVLEYNLGLLLQIKEKADVGFVFSPKDAITLIGRIKTAFGLNIGYSYDFHITELGNYNMGSHELLLGYCF